MTTDLATRNGSSLTIREDQDGFNEKQVAALRQIGVDQATNGDLAVFFHQCQRTGLDPFAKQIYMIGRWSREGTKYTIQTAIDGYRLIARRAADGARVSLGYEDTQWCGEDGRWVDVWLSSEHPSAARVVVLRNGQRFPGLAMWSEYVQTVKDKQTGDLVPNSMWSKMGAGQLAKCAEALALRKAFPQDLSGIYTTDEMGQADNPSAPRQQAERPTSLAQAVSQHQATQHAEQVPQSAPESNLRTTAQATKLAVLIRENSLQRDEALAYFGSLIGREVESTKELTKSEASKIIDTLQSAADGNVDLQTGELKSDVVDAELVDPSDDWPQAG